MKTRDTNIVAGALCALAFTASGARAEVTKPAPRTPAPASDVKMPAPAVHKSPVADNRRALAPDPVASAPQRTAPAPVADPLAGRVAYADDVQGTWAASARYKARTSAESTTFVPFFGSDKPRSAPLAFTTRSIRAAGQPVANQLGRVVREGNRVSIERGDVDERWEFAPEGAEQLFVIDRPLAAGDVAVRVGFEGEYTAVADADGVLFTSELGRVRYGKAVAIDAAGVRTAVGEEIVDGAIELVVPAAFLATAAYPVTIDPVVTSYFVESSSEHAVNPDVAYEAGSGKYLYVWERVFSSSDHDVFARLGDDNGLDAGALITIDVSSANWAHPSVASNFLAHNFLVVAETGPEGQRSIRGRRVDGATGATGADFLVQNFGGGEKIHPVVGGDPSTVAPTYYCVAWERAYSGTDHDIQATLVEGPENGPAHPLITVDNTTDTFDAWPSISKCDGGYPFATQVWSIVWERTFSPNDGDIHGAQLAWDGTILHGTFPVDVTGNDDRRPAVSSITEGATGERPYAAVWTRQMNPGDRDILVAALVGDHVTDEIDAMNTVFLPTYDDLTPAIDCDGHMFALAWSKNWAPSDNDVLAQILSVSGGTIGLVGDVMAVSASSFFEWNPAITSKHSGGALSARFAVPCERYSGAQMDIYAAVIAAPNGVPLASYCAGLAGTCPCGNAGGGVGGCANSVNAAGAILGANGEAVVSGDSLSLTASGMPATTTCLFFQGSAPVNSPSGVPFGDGLRCVGGTTVRLGTKTATAGSASYPAGADPRISVRGLVPVVGGTRYYQAWYRNAASFCTSSTFNLSNGLRATWLP